MNNYAPFVSGAISGFIEVSITHPFDLLKTKLQEAIQKKLVPRSSLITISKSIYTTGGISGFYKGLSLKIIGTVPMRLTYWSSQYYATSYLQKNGYTHHKALVYGGVIGGFAQTIIDNPLEVIKTRIITQNISITKAIGLPYPGFIPTLIRNSIFAICVNNAISYKKANNPLYNFLIGAGGGFCGSMLSHPFDYIKTEYHRQTKNLSKKISKNIYKKIIKDVTISPTILMTGCIPRATLGFFNMGIGAVVFISLQNYLSK